jgi:hypothetical protein
VAAGGVAFVVGDWISVGVLSGRAAGAQAENKTTAAKLAISLRAVVDLNIEGDNPTIMVRNYIRPLAILFFVKFFHLIDQNIQFLSAPGIGRGTHLVAQVV